MSYRARLPLVLQDFGLHIEPGERIGVTGRIGAGKSSSMGTSFRPVEPRGDGSKIDGIDTLTVRLEDLRVRLTIVPQDPTLVKATIRSNFDPFNKSYDLQLWPALRQADLVNLETIIQSPTNKTDVATEQTTTSCSGAQCRMILLTRTSGKCPATRRNINSN